MNYRDDQNNGSIKNIEDGVRKPAKERPPKNLVHDRVELRIVQNGGVNVFQLGLESHRKVRRDVAQPLHRLVNIGGRFGRNDKSRCHFRLNSSFLISSQGLADDGFA